MGQSSTRESGTKGPDANNLIAMGYLATAKTIQIKSISKLDNRRIENLNERTFWTPWSADEFLTFAWSKVKANGEFFECKQQGFFTKKGWKSNQMRIPVESKSLGIDKTWTMTSEMEYIRKTQLVRWDVKFYEGGALKYRFSLKIPFKMSDGQANEFEMLIDNDVDEPECFDITAQYCRIESYSWDSQCMMRDTGKESRTGFYTTCTLKVKKNQSLLEKNKKKWFSEYPRLPRFNNQEHETPTEGEA